jgi:DNA-binding NtrC family response regulator
MAQEENNKTATRVLYVDSDKSIVFVAKQILELFDGLEIDLATSFPEANKALEKKRYDVIISGYFIDAYKNGLDFFKELKAKGCKVPFIMFSIYDEIADEARKMGITKFVAMNGDCEKVYAELSNCIKKVKHKDHY